MTTTVEPERELVRRLLPFALPAPRSRRVLGALVGGAGAAWSAAIGIVVVAANFVAHGVSMAWAARDLADGPDARSVSVATSCALAIFTLALLGLNKLAWFSPLAFVAAFAPATIALLVVEMKLLAGRMQADLWRFPRAAQRHVIARVLAERVPAADDQGLRLRLLLSVDSCRRRDSVSTSSSCSLVTSVLVFFLFFFFAFRRPNAVPGKLQSPRSSASSSCARTSRSDDRPPRPSSCRCSRPSSSRSCSGTSSRWSRA